MEPLDEPVVAGLVQTGTHDFSHEASNEVCAARSKRLSAGLPERAAVRMAYSTVGSGVELHVLPSYLHASFPTGFCNLWVARPERAGARKAYSTVDPGGSREKLWSADR